MAILFSEKAFLAAGLLVALAGLAAATRYKPCSEGCCKNEFCAYDLVCYPVTKCRFGCPDGECVSDDEGEKACLPEPPCTSSHDCKMGHACTMNYNLGYTTCQYDLSIGSTLCELGLPNQHGSPMAANTWEQKRSFLARWRGKAAFRPKGQKGSN